MFISSLVYEALGNFNYFWIGGIMRTVMTNGGKSLDVWSWTKDNALMIFSDWDPSAPATGNCTGVETNGFWSAIDCKISNPFVCEIPAQFSYCEEGWTYFNMTNSCFKKFAVRTPINQSSAKNACTQRSGHLASIHTVEENEFIGDLTSIGDRVNGGASVFWIGAQTNDNSDNWYWTDGSKFDYANWGYNYDYTYNLCSSFWPDETTNHNNKINQWNAFFCDDALYGYLCKKPSNTIPIC
uniref:C-type lectin domain-containing protein n=1 Tax=Panagrolaimus sp. JU765 TaxID=591449 RepID=A0AC34QA62_9BILA